MNGRNSYLVVGIFVSVGLVTLISMILIFAGGRSTEPTTRYTIFFQRDVSGLTLGAPVRYLGVRVGEVNTMSLTTHDFTEVRVDLEVLQSTPITAATYASLAFQGVTGVAFISLAADQNGQTNKLVADDFEYPVIPTRDTGLAALLSDAPEITRKVTQLLDQASQLLDENNQAALAGSLANIEAMTESLPGELRTVLAEGENTLRQLQSTLDQAQPDIVSVGH